MKIVATVPATTDPAKLSAALGRDHYSWHWTGASGPKLLVIYGPAYGHAKAAVDGLGGTVLPPLHSPELLSAAHVTAFASLAAVTLADTAYSACEKLLTTVGWPVVDPAEP